MDEKKNLKTVSKGLAALQAQEEKKLMQRHLQSQKKQPPKQPAAGQRSPVQKVQENLDGVE